MDELIYSRGTKKLVEINASVKPGEKAIIVTDFAMEKIAKRVARAVAACGAEVVICFMSPREWDCQEPPEMVAAALKKADVIFSPVSVSIAWTAAIKSALELGARSILMTGFDDSIFISRALLDTDFEEQAKICERLSELYTPAKVVRLTTDLGTDLTFNKNGRRTNLVTSIPKSGQTGSAPNIEINVVPLEGTSNGKIIVDGSIPYLGIGVLKEPIECTIKDGFITNISGGDAAEKLKANLESFQDPNCYNIAEFGVGLNPNAGLCGIMLEDEGVFGTIHIGIGTSISLGGKINAPIHYDLIIKNVKIELDGKIVQNNRELFI